MGDFASEGIFAESIKVFGKIKEKVLEKQYYCPLHFLQKLNTF